MTDPLREATDELRQLHEHVHTAMSWDECEVCGIIRAALVAQPPTSEPSAPEEFDFVNGREAWEAGYGAALATQPSPSEPWLGPEYASALSKHLGSPSPSEPELVCNCQNGDGTSHAKYHAVGCPIRTGVPPSPSEGPLDVALVAAVEDAITLLRTGYVKASMPPGEPDETIAALRAARGSGLDVERLAEAWANVMDGRRIGSGLNAARIGRDTTTTDDWRAIAAEYAALASHSPATEEGTP